MSGAASSSYPTAGNYKLGTNGQIVVTGVFTVADAGGVAAGDVLTMNGASAVKRTTASNDKIIGVAYTTAANGAAVDVVVLGIVTLTADVAITQGNILIASTVGTAGRAGSSNSYTPTGSNAAALVNLANGAITDQLVGNTGTGTALTNTGGGAVTGLTGVQAAAFTGVATNRSRSYGIAITTAAGAGSTFTAFINSGTGSP